MQTGPEFPSVSSYKGILYLKKLGGDQLKKQPCSLQVTRPPKVGLYNLIFFPLNILDWVGLVGNRPSTD